jgi:hypothetical protein
VHPTAVWPEDAPKVAVPEPKAVRHAPAVVLSHADAVAPQQLGLGPQRVLDLAEKLAFGGRAAPA